MYSKTEPSRRNEVNGHCVPHKNPSELAKFICTSELSLSCYLVVNLLTINHGNFCLILIYFHYLSIMYELIHDTKALYVIEYTLLEELTRYMGTRQQSWSTNSDLRHSSTIKL